MIYQTELLNLENPQNAKFICSLLYDCLLVNGKKGTDPRINNFYFKYHGTKEEYENSEKELNGFMKIREENIHKLEEQVKDIPDNVKKVRQDFLFNGQIYFIEMSRE